MTEKKSKICVACNLEFPATTEFWHILKQGKYGLRGKCKKCACEEERERRKSPERKEKHRINMAKWKKNNPEKVLESSRKTYKINAEKRKQEAKERYWRRKSEQEKQHYYLRSTKSREENRAHLRELYRSYRIELRNSYVACTMRMSVKDVTPEIIETKRLIIQLKRELKNNNIKIR